MTEHNQNRTPDPRDQNGPQSPYGAPGPQAPYGAPQDSGQDTGQDAGQHMGQGAAAGGMPPQGDPGADRPFPQDGQELRGWTQNPGGGWSYGSVQNDYGYPQQGGQGAWQQGAPGSPQADWQQPNTWEQQGGWQQQGAWQQGGAPAAGYGYQGAPVSDNDRIVAIIAHLSMLVATVISAAWIGFIAPLIFWFLYKDRSPLVRGASAGAFNFSITLWITSTVALLLQPTIILAPIGWILWVAVYAAGILLPILAALRANKGEIYKYPLAIPILK